MANLKTRADSWGEFDAYLGAKTVRTIGNNTYAERQPNGSIGVRLHATTVVIFHRDETITLNSGGWRTVTTKDRINTLLPGGLRVYSERGVWTVSRYGREPATVSQFYDGMTFTREGAMLTDVLVDDGAELKKVKREISRYVKLYDEETVARLVADAAEKGTGGDCWYCAMFAPAGHDSTDHLLSHMEEVYTMASLMVNALKHIGYQDWQIPFNVRHAYIVRRAIRRYLTESLTTSHGARPTGRPDRSVGFSNNVA